MPTRHSLVRNTNNYFGVSYYLPDFVKVLIVRYSSFYLKSRGAKSFRHRRHVSHSWAVPCDSK